VASAQPSTVAAARPTLRLRRDPALRSRAARGDAAAFAVLYERHHQALYRYCRSILRHDEDAQDALQSTMAKAFAALQTEDRDFELQPWLFRIAHNEAISLLRQRRATLQLDEARDVGVDSLPRAVADRERLAELRADLADLPERQRAALVLRELSGLGHAQIAAVLECSTTAAKQTIFEARAALHECAEGRAMACADVQRALSDGDGRVLRGRRMRAHLRGCRSCQAFRAALGQRPHDLAALVPPLPAAAGAALLGHLLPGAKATVASGGASAPGVGGGIAATLGTKVAVVAATAAAVAGGTAATTRIVGQHSSARPTSERHHTPAVGGAPRSGDKALDPRAASPAPRAAKRGGAPQRRDGTGSDARGRGAGGHSGRAAHPATGPPAHARRPAKGPRAMRRANARGGGGRPHGVTRARGKPPRPTRPPKPTPAQTPSLPSGGAGAGGAPHPATSPAGSVGGQGSAGGAGSGERSGGSR